MTLQHLTELLKNQSESAMPICFQTFVIYWIEKDSDQAGTESWKRTNNLKSPSPLHPLRGAKIAAKVIEDVHVVAARVPKVTRFATSLGTENVKKEKTVLISMSKTPSQDLVPPKRRGRGRVSPFKDVKEGTAKTPCTYFQQDKCRRRVVASVFISMKMQLLPQRIQSEQIALHQRRRLAGSAKAALCITQRYACIAKGPDSGPKNGATILK